MTVWPVDYDVRKIRAMFLKKGNNDKENKRKEKKLHKTEKYAVHAFHNGLHRI